ncbi:GH11773 [Drosophila grimshawi]|uniref:GH11773 n=1 Tax=Drosophila grimshawi TaxID=7222 RepID=B4K2M2_DROGR|nr:GH11773 [Drosophila grimshawi]
MADSFSNWMPTHNLIATSNDNDDEQDRELLMENHPFVPRFSSFRDELNNLSQLRKLYRTMPDRGTGPLTDDEKLEIIRRNNENQDQDDQENDNE